MSTRIATQPATKLYKHSKDFHSQHNITSQANEQRRRRRRKKPYAQKGKHTRNWKEQPKQKKNFSYAKKIFSGATKTKSVEEND